jgi:hypothetical protein
MTARKFEAKTLRQLRLRFSGPDDPRLTGRRSELVAIFSAVSDPIVAAVLASGLVTRLGGDELSREFHRQARHCHAAGSDRSCRRRLGGHQRFQNSPQARQNRRAALHRAVLAPLLNCKLEIDKDEPQWPLFATKHAIC